MNENIACAHLVVIYLPIPNDDGTSSDVWECKDCNMRFIAMPFYNLLEIEYDKLIKFIDEDVFACDLDGIFRSFSIETMRRLHDKEPETYCEHKQIMLHKLGRADGSLDEWWQCDRCEQKFSPKGSTYKNEQD